MTDRASPVAAGRALVAAALLCGLGACQRTPAPSAPAAPDAGAATAKPEALRGTLRKGDKSLRVGPIIAHSPGMDLFVRCRELVDRSQGAQPLCYGPTKREQVSVLRVEYHPRLGGGVAMQLLRAKDEGAHFVVEPSGSIYQILDLAYAPRRDGSVRAGEVRILSGSKPGSDRLVAALRALFPELTVQPVDLDLPAPPAPPAGGAPGAPAPAGTTGPGAAGRAPSPVLPAPHGLHGLHGPHAPHAPAAVPAPGAPPSPGSPVPQGPTPRPSPAPPAPSP
jgi:hypothetical protein